MGKKKNKVKLSVHAMKANKGSGGTATQKKNPVPIK